MLSRFLIEKCKIKKRNESNKQSLCKQMLTDALHIFFQQLKEIVIIFVDYKPANNNYKYKYK